MENLSSLDYNNKIRQNTSNASNILKTNLSLSSNNNNNKNFSNNNLHQIPNPNFPINNNGIIPNKKNLGELNKEFLNLNNPKTVKIPDLNNINEDSSYFAEEQNTNFTRQQVIKKCSNIFFIFSKFDKKDKQYYIPISNIKKIFKKVNLIDEKTLKTSDMDILIKKINPNVSKFIEKNFLDLIVMIAARIYPKDYKKNPKNTLDNLISNFFEPYSNHIIDNEENLEESLKLPYTHRTFDLLITRFSIDYKLIAILNNVLFAIKEIYKNYFSYENLSSKNFAKISENSQNDLIKFCKDFEIIPFVLNENQLVIYYDLFIKIEIKNLTNNPNLEKENFDNYIIDPKKDIGSVFTMSKFCASLIHFSIFSYSKNNQQNLNNLNDTEKFLIFLEKLENSKGFKNFEKKSNRPHTNKLTLIPNKTVLKMINSQLLEAYDFFNEENNNNNINNINSSILNHNNISSLSKSDLDFNINSRKNLQPDKILKEYNERLRNNEDYQLKNLLLVNEEIYEYLILSNIDSLKDLFLKYAKLGEKFNNAKISLSSYIKFLKDSGVLPNETGNIKSLNFNLVKNSVSTVHLSKTPTKLSFRKTLSSLSKSPMSSSINILKEKDSNGKLSVNNSICFLQPGVGNTEKKLNENNKILNYKFYGPGERKLCDSDVNVIFSNLIGPRNIDNSGKIKQQFDKNLGFGYAPNEVSKYAVIDRQIQLKSGKGSFSTKMDFYMFIKSFELLAGKIYPELKLDVSFQKFFNEYVSKLLNSIESIMATKYMQEIIERVRNPEMKNFLSELFNYLLGHYQNFSDNKGLMSFEQLFDFYKDFALFPDIITLVQIKTIFNSLSDHFYNESNINLNKNKNLNESKSFYTESEKSLAITAMSFKLNEKISDIDKTLYLIERMNQSKGINSFQFRCGNSINTSKDLVNFLSIMKNKYPAFYAVKNTKEESKMNPIRFDDIYTENEDY